MELLVVETGGPDSGATRKLKGRRLLAQWMGKQHEDGSSHKGMKLINMGDD